jgi:t-SNARE complex subunit (syntaxin)
LNDEELEELLRDMVEAVIRMSENVESIATTLRMAEQRMEEEDD